VAHLKRFLSFAQLGARAFATMPNAPLGEVESPFEAAVAERLRGKGWVLHPQVGVSGFRVDLGIVDPDRPGAYLAGVECDGATYHRGATARDRDRLRQAVLEGLGWHVIRIWSTDWWTGAARETERLHEQLTARLSERRARRAEEEPEIVVAAEPTTPDSSELTDSVSSPASIVVDSARFYDEGYRATLSALIARELSNHGPLRRDRLIQRVARAHGFQRAGREIQERIEAAIPSELKRTKDSSGTFIWPLDHDPAAARAFEVINGVVRDPTEVPIEQLRVLALECGAGMQEDAEVLIAMRNVCGLQKMGTTVRARLEDALVRPQV
jgi:very-short-patch-repair endonuclease